MEENNYWNYMERGELSPLQLDVLLADGWRHFGTFFFRDILSWNGDTLSLIIPLRINLNIFKPSKSQRKILRKNNHIKVLFRDAFIDEAKEILFHKHCQRFKSNIPDSIFDFLSKEPSRIPCHTVECCLLDENDYMYAVSFLDIGKHSTSSVYAMFDPAYSHLSPGLHTLLEEINYSHCLNKHFLYTGYAFRESSHYDYKKKFKGTEYYDWRGNWFDLKDFPVEDLEEEE